MRFLPLIPALILSGAAATAAPSDDAIAYVEDNVLAIFYHELGHALIDVLQLPVLGQEEDAADVLSVVLTDQLWEEEQAGAVATASALFYLALASETEPEDVVWWSVHGPDLQRHYNTICLFYGANPDLRQAYAEGFDLPADRAAGCPEEYDLAAGSWGVFLDEIETGEPGDSLRFAVDPADSISILLADEVVALNEAFLLPEPVDVFLDSCGEPNAFYDPGARSITICTELVDFLQEQAAAMGM
jgi:hypothetical protein